MVKHLLSLGLIFLFTQSFGQEKDYSNDWLQDIENPKSSSYQLNPENLIDIYQDCNFSVLLNPQSEFLGYVSSDFRKINIVFSSIIKDTLKNEYAVTGYSLVSNNKCDFTGTIEITQIREIEIVQFGSDKEYKEENINFRGILIGNYLFSEQEDQFHAGEFRGIMTLHWYINALGSLHYDKIDIFSNKYANNQYVGIWEDYSNGEKKTCNWGEYRIPYCGDLDIGKTEFNPNPKYKDMGWFETNNNLQKSTNEQ